jgi:D-cysteine desulfhydrase
VPGLGGFRPEDVVLRQGAAEGAGLAATLRAIEPLGASDEFGSIGFVKAMEELVKQEKAMGLEFDYIFHSSSSGGTQAGLEIGKRLFKMNTQILTPRRTLIGICL